MLKTLLMKFRQKLFKNPLRRQPSFPYDMRGIIKYASSSNKKLSELSTDELNMFLLKKN